MYKNEFRCMTESDKRNYGKFGLPISDYIWRFEIGLAKIALDKYIQNVKKIYNTHRIIFKN